MAASTRGDGDGYNYAKVEYVTAKSEVMITCQLYGDFLQKPTNPSVGSRS